MTRPVTHDLLHQVIFRLRGAVDRIRITDLQSGTFFAEVVLGTLEGEVRLDARPSDAIALALRAKAPVFVEQHVVDEAIRIEAANEMASFSITSPRPVVDPCPEGCGETLLSSLNDEDFGKWKM